MAGESSKTTIQVSRETKRLIDSLKIIPAESNDSVLKRIILEEKNIVKMLPENEEKYGPLMRRLGYTVLII